MLPSPRSGICVFEDSCQAWLQSSQKGGGNGSSPFVREPQDGEEALALGFHADRVLSRKVKEKQQHWLNSIYKYWPSTNTAPQRMANSTTGTFFFFCNRIMIKYQIYGKCWILYRNKSISWAWAKRAEWEDEAGDSTGQRGRPRWACCRCDSAVLSSWASVPSVVVHDPAWWATPQALRVCADLGQFQVIP